MSIVKVARAAGVSYATVSRVINRHANVAPETVRAVQAAIEKTGFVLSDRRPGPKPHSRRANGTRRICFLVRGPAETSAYSVSSVPPGFIALLHGVESACVKAKVEFQVKFAGNTDRTLEELASNPVDGVLLHGAFSGGGLESWLRRVPCVWLMANPRRPEWGDQVLPDNEIIGETASAYLLKNAHRRLACLNLQGQMWGHQRKVASFVSASRTAGAMVESLEETIPTLEHGPGLRVAIDSLVSRYAALRPRPAGLFIVDDRQMGLLHPALARRALLPTRSNALISCNHETPYLEGLDPRPATIDIQFDTIGRLGAQMLVWRMENTGLPPRIRSAVEPTLVAP
jgi:DNA-binding LacI/PurR family transcriptional regulator